MARKLKSDKALFLATLLLVFASVVMVFSASAYINAFRYEEPHRLLVKQGLWAALGMALLGIAMRIDYRIWRQPVVVGGAVAIAFLLLVAVLFSTPINGTRRWFGVGGFGIQPSELAKLAAILFVAALLERRMRRINELKEVAWPIALVIGAMTALIMLEPDFGTSACLVATVGVMVFTAGFSLRYIALSALVLVPPAFLAVWLSDYRWKRLTAFLCPECDPLGSGFQLLQSLIAVGTGGLTGRGLMGGVQKMFYLPEPHTDFIFAVIAEEAGLIGTTLTVVAFAVIIWRGLRVAGRAPDQFGAFLATGLTAMIAVQALVNLSVVLGLVPTKGIPLPFVSAGGSSLLINLVGMGILLNVSQHASAVHEA
jgi:cell division protein FtsW